MSRDEKRYKDYAGETSCRCDWRRGKAAKGSEIKKEEAGQVVPPPRVPFRGSPARRVAHLIPPIFLFDEEARGEDTTFVIHRGVIRGGCPTLSERKGGLFFSFNAEKSETTLRTR